MEAILRSPSYSLAQDDRVLLERTEMRGVRMLLELGKPELAFQEDNVESTVIVFGGTQITEKNTAERRLSEAIRNQSMDVDNKKLPLKFNEVKNSSSYHIFMMTQDNLLDLFR